jgi:eukaryotic-like serine/threonine-protein kinase
MVSPLRGGFASFGEATLSAVDEKPTETAQGPTEELFADLHENELDAKELPSGTRVGRYVTNELIGRGAMGTVYAAKDPHLARKVAVKLLRAEALSEAARQKMRARLLREAQAMARLSHPEVIAVYDVGAFGEQLFVAMEYVEGETLRQWRAAQHRGYREILAVYERAGSGLAAAHEAGLVHRDFKPDNVLVARDGRVRVTDFGLARRNATQADTAAERSPEDIGSSEDPQFALTLTRTGSLLGTPAYMAPEQLRGGVADARSDVFSFCVALYEALYGERPFGGSTILALQSAIEQGAVRPAPMMTRVPTWVRAVLLRGLRASPNERFPSMRALLDALRTVHATARRRTWRMLAIAAGVLGAAFAVVGPLRSTASIVQHAGVDAPTGLVATGASMPSGRPPIDEWPSTPAVPAPTAPAVSVPAVVDVARRPPALSPSKIASPQAARPRATLPPRGAQAQSAAPLIRAPSLGKNGAFIVE